ncbi:alpha/beta hydrolase family esterase [Methylobrevis pamukkalensis]|uniref:Alpha/beta hydrolase family protein n=1 Tax=Methylobrevis pamukkalensis TaxID=1439726 RepID=A0A1E3H8F3_9HYPH|nr:poly(3-hydroxybutyrate) depolymerase [Methylobrevis pamukkalensis]ODN72607.1 Alpha/beta hydrolase family protein [Methylobrevis pamukkalensis]
MLVRSLAAGVLLGIAACTATLAADCGGGTVCSIRGGDYRIELPADGDVRGAYVFFHGYKSSAALQIGQRGLVDTTLAHHLAFVAVDGLAGRWSFPGNPQQGRDDQAFVADVLTDLETRFGITGPSTVIGGFSIGASMAWYTACLQGDKVAGLVTFSGVFWNPLPQAGDCTRNLPPMVHFHGTADRTFPLSGRAIGSRLHQGDTFRSIAILREQARCDIEQPRTATLDGLACDEAPGCVRGASLLCIHDGGHVVRSGDVDAGLSAVGFPR